MSIDIQDLQFKPMVGRKSPDASMEKIDCIDLARGAVPASRDDAYEWLLARIVARTGKRDNDALDNARNQLVDHMMVAEAARTEIRLTGALNRHGQSFDCEHLRATLHTWLS